MRIHWVTLALQAINFLALAWLLHRFLYRPVLDLLARRKALVDKAEADAAAGRQAAEALRRELEQQRAAIDGERRAALEAAHGQAEAERAALRERAQEEADAIHADARQRLGREREEALRELRVEAAELARAQAGALLAAVGPPPAGAFLDRAFALLRARPAPALRALAPRPGEGAIRVLAAAPLTAAEQERCRSELAELLGAAPEVRFEEEPALVGGVELHFPAEVLRCTWQEALGAAQEELTRDADAARRAG